MKSLTIKTADNKEVKVTLFDVPAVDNYGKKFQVGYTETKGKNGTPVAVRHGVLRNEIIGILANNLFNEADTSKSMLDWAKAVFAIRKAERVAKEEKAKASSSKQ